LTTQIYNDQTSAVIIICKNTELSQILLRQWFT